MKTFPFVRFGYLLVRLTRVAFPDDLEAPAAGAPEMSSGPLSRSAAG
jgi:hypothetical protein